MFHFGNFQENTIRDILGRYYVTQTPLVVSYRLFQQKSSYFVNAITDTDKICAIIYEFEKEERLIELDV